MLIIMMNYMVSLNFDSVHKKLFLTLHCVIDILNVLRIALNWGDILAPFPHTNMGDFAIRYFPFWNVYMTKRDFP